MYQCKALFTGHRVQDLGGFKENKLQASIKAAIHNVLIDLKKDYGSDFCILTSLSLGIETWIAEMCYSDNIDYHVYIPYSNMESKWSSYARHQYQFLLKNARKKILLDNESYAYEKLINKDVKMIEDATEIYTFFAQPQQFHKLLERLGKSDIDLMPDGDNDDYFIRF